MAKGFYVSKLVAFVGIFFAIAAVATIIALAVVFANEKSKNDKEETGGSLTTTISGPSSTTTTTTRTTTTGTQTSTTPASNEIWDKYRLPKSFRPIHYDLDFRPILEKDSRGIYVFYGKSVAYFRCVERTNLVIIHSNKLNYSTAELWNDDAIRNIPITTTHLVEKTNYLVLHLGEELEENKIYRLHTEFIGELADDLAGFYRSEYVEDGVTKIIATTQMAAPDARKAFPCFDEPAMKATFSITLRHKPDYVALSNMNPISVSNEIWNVSELWNITIFEKTPPMSTYLVAFIVSQFSWIGDDKVKIWGRKKAVEDYKQAEYAMNVTRPILEFFEHYYNVSYPLPKLDQVALPDFVAGAMENWGLVTYRETALFYDVNESSIGNKERVVTVIAHELAHQWFGNLVTIRWWNDLWLNEGFANYVEYLGADFAEPTWNIKDLIVLNDVHRVMAVDALLSSHPLTSKEEDVNSPGQISELFDSITYSKGASVIRMLSSFLTEEIFVNGLTAMWFGFGEPLHTHVTQTQTYLKAFEYNNTVYEDLWVHLQMAVDQSSLGLKYSVEEIMNTWVLQMGFPVVTIDTSVGRVEQQHFLLDPEATIKKHEEENYSMLSTCYIHQEEFNNKDNGFWSCTESFSYTWIIPITYINNNNGSSEQGNFWLKNLSDINDILKTDGKSWFLANTNVTGYYRVNYDEGNWDRLIAQLNNDVSAIPISNRAQIIDDAFNLARAKLINTTRALDTTTFLSKEVEYMPWQAALNNLNYFSQMFDRTEVYGSMTGYMQKQVTPLFKYFEDQTDSNWTKRPETLTEQYNEINSVSIACSYGITKCGELATKLFREWMNTNMNGIHPNLRNAIYCNAIARGGVEEWDFTWAEFKKTENAQEADKLRAALACSKEPWILNRLLEYSLDSSKIRRQDCVTTITSVANNVVGQSLAWDFVRAKWSLLFSQFGQSSFSFGNLITGVTGRFSTEYDLQQLEQFKKDNEQNGFGTSERALEQCIEKTEANINWVNQNKASVQKWFEDAVRP